MADIELPFTTNISGAFSKYLTSIPNIKPNISYTLTGKCSDGTELNALNSVFVIMKGNTQLLNWGLGRTNLTTTDISEATSAYIYTNATLAGKTITEFQIEKNTTSTPYTLHKEQVLPLTLGNIELCKIGDYQDYFYKESNKWYLHKEIGKVVYDGTETGESHYWYVQDENNHSYQITDNTIHLKESKKGICNCFIINNSGASPYLYPILQAGTSYCRFVTYNITGTISTLEEWKRWLSSNNIVFYYPLATPTDTEITDTTLISQLEAINNAISYEEQTNISSNQNALFSVEAYQSTKLVLEERDAKYESLEARVALLE